MASMLVPVARNEQSALAIRQLCWEFRILLWVMEVLMSAAIFPPDFSVVGQQMELSADVLLWLFKRKITMYHANMQSCRMKEKVMHTIKTVGKSGQISLGKAMAGMDFILEQLPGGDIMLKRAVIVPMNERWLHEPAMKEKLARADNWMRDNPPQETNLDELESKLGADA